MDVNDYLIDHASFDWPKLLSSWAWFLDEEMEVQPWLMNRFGDLFFVDEVGVVLWLNINDGELTEVASNVDEFFELLEEDDVPDEDEDIEDEDDADESASSWFLMGFVDEVSEAGMKLGPNQCYGFKVPPILGGEYDITNVYVANVEEYWGFCGDIHSKLDGLPDGAEVEIEIRTPDSG